MLGHLLDVGPKFSHIGSPIRVYSVGFVSPQFSQFGKYILMIKASKISVGPIAVDP